MKKLIPLCLLMVVFSVQYVNGQQLGDRYSERNARFSMSMPWAWQAVDFNQKYLMITGPEDDGFTPNIGFGDEEYSGSIAQYIDAALNFLPRVYSDYSLLNRSSFKTDAGATGECITHLCTIGNIRVRQKMYAFPNRRGTAVMLITCTAPISGGEKYDPVFDASVRTFRWTR